MTSLTGNHLLKLHKPNTVSRKINTGYLTSGNSVKTKISKLEPPSFSSTAVKGDSGQTRTRTRTRTQYSSRIRSSKIDQLSSQMAASPPTVEDRITKISSTIRVIPDFPKPGIMFQDITTLLLDPVAFKDTIDLFVDRYKDENIAVVAGIEARGFIFGPPIALAIGAKFVPMRKPKKLPGEVISEEYSLEYGTDKMEMHVGAVQAGERVLIIDDLIATGGTLCAAMRLLERVGAHVVECACVIELADLKGRDRLGEKPLFVLISST